MRRSQELQCVRIHRSARTTTGAISAELRSATMIHDGFAQNRTRGIAGTKKKNVVGIVHLEPHLQQGRPTQPGGHSHFVFGWSSWRAGCWLAEGLISEFFRISLSSALC